MIPLVVLGGWLIPSVGSTLPIDWSLMKVNAALSFLLCTASLALTTARLSHRYLLLGRAGATAVIVIAGTSLVEHATGYSSGLGTLLAADPGGNVPGRLSIQSATFLVLLAVSVLLGRPRRRLPAAVLDTTVAALALLTLLVVQGYWFNASALIGQSPGIRTSPQSLTCMVLLTFAAVSRRTEQGALAVLVGVGVGSDIGRTLLPLTLLVPFVLTALASYVLSAGLLSAPYVATLGASAATFVLLFVVVMMAWRINDLQRELLDMSLSDELTHVYNRRGFYLFGEQAWREAQRGGRPLTVLYFDLDGLKHVNDSLGHDVGSDLVLDFAGLLRANFRGSDVLGRVGGGEFVLVSSSLHAGLMPALRRVNDVAEQRHHAGDKPCRVRFSVGHAVSEPLRDQSFADLVNRADQAMFEHKRMKALATHVAGSVV